ncbi:Arm DNA-binding domain-containing protein [Methyloglobulus sp.]|uniref:Arm DNA-binding domain-containing protein n=1 Tax=Methyloglobulus sp. TaxID=2518622 RepID=UPI00398A07C9
MANKITDLTIKSWFVGRFEGRACSNGLYLVYRETMATPLWRFRYRLSGQQRQMFIGSYKDLSLAEATKEGKRLNALVALGHDVAKEKQDRKLDGTPHKNSGAWGSWPKLILEGASLLGKRSAVKVLLEGEKAAEADYAAALKDPALSADIHTLIETKLLPTQQSHIRSLDRVLDAIPA